MKRKVRKGSIALGVGVAVLFVVLWSVPMVRAVSLYQKSRAYLSESSSLNAANDVAFARTLLSSCTRFVVRRTGSGPVSFASTTVRVAPRSRDRGGRSRRRSDSAEWGIADCSFSNRVAMAACDYQRRRVAIAAAQLLRLRFSFSARAKQSCGSDRGADGDDCGGGPRI